jgi:SnoaL-like domain
MHPVSRYVPLLIAGDLEGLRDLFGNVPRVNDPRLGWVEGSLFERFVAASYRGLTKRQARVEHLSVTATPRGAVEECILSLVRPSGEVRLPVAIAAVIASDVLVSIQIYHSLWPLMGSHAVRPPVLPALAEIVLPGVIGRYHESLGRGDVPGVLEQFEMDGVVRAATGELHLFRGAAELRRFFGELLAPGGLSMENCSVTDDGTCCALEYNVTGWGDRLLPHQAGIAVYNRSRTGLLSSARIYDDLDPASRGN